MSANPYAPPKAAVDLAQQVGQLWRSGALVRMERSGALPDRCVVCNAEAGGYRLSRKLYWSPLAWRLGATAAPFVVGGIGVATGSPLLILLFWPLGLVLMLVHVFVRKQIELDLGVCPRHRRLRAALRVLSIACVVALISANYVASELATGVALMWGAIAGLLVLALAQSLVGVQAVSVKKLTDEHAWLARTGRAFRAALPELRE